jgi:glucosylceramidase
MFTQMRRLGAPESIRTTRAKAAAKAALLAFSVGALALAVFSCVSKEGVPAKDAAFLVSRGGKDFSSAAVAKLGGDGAEFEIADETAGPALEGFGGAFNEKGWEALSHLSGADRAAVLKNVFSPDGGLRLNLNRIPVGSSDYALSRYSLAPVAGDFEMKFFSIDRDREALIPYIKAAQALNPGMRFWASAWSPPAWMKDNGSSDSGTMLDDPKVYAAYALYLAKFSEAYLAEGIPLDAVAVQNEPYILTAYPSCRWAPDQYLTFVRDHLGPLLSARKSKTGIMLGTFNQGDNRAHAMSVISDPQASRYVYALGLQWSGLSIAPSVLAEAPGLRVWHTETDCGNHHWEPGFDPDKPQNDFAYAAYTWKLMRDYLDGGASLYSLWNIVLDEEGKSIDSRRPWPQNSAIVVDRKARKAIYTPMYYAFASYSRFLPPGSKRLEASGSRDAIAFLLPDGKRAVILLNAQGAAKSMSIGSGGKAYSVELPERSFGVLLID